MKYKKRIVGLLLVVEVISIFMMYKSVSNKKTILDNISINKINKDMFAMYVKENGSYVESKDSTFPEGYMLNINNSKCVDNNGDEVKNVLVAKKDCILIKQE